MIEQKYICDNCNKQIDLTEDIFLDIPMEININSMGAIRHYCQDCSNEIIYLIDKHKENMSKLGCGKSVSAIKDITKHMRK